MASDDLAGPGQGSARPVPESCPADCRAHREHVYILCYGQPVIVKDRDYLLADAARRLSDHALCRVHTAAAPGETDQVARCPLSAPGVNGADIRA